MPSRPPIVCCATSWQPGGDACLPRRRHGDAAAPELCQVRVNVPHLLQPRRRRHAWQTRTRIDRVLVDTCNFQKNCAGAILI